MRHRDEPGEAWSLVLSDYLVVAIKTDEGVRIMYDEEAEEFAIRRLVDVFKRDYRIYCKDCGAILTPENVGQITKDEEGNITGRCIYCLDDEILHMIRCRKKALLIKTRPEISRTGDKM